MGTHGGRNPVSEQRPRAHVVSFLFHPLRGQQLLQPGFNHPEFGMFGELRMICLLGRQTQMGSLKLLLSKY